MSYEILNISKFSNSHSIFSSPSVSPASHAGYCSVYVLRIHSQPKRALPHYTPQAKYSLFIILSIYHVGLTILRRIADYFVQNRRFFLQESQIFCTFAANFEKYTIWT